MSVVELRFSPTLRAEAMGLKRLYRDGDVGQALSWRMQTTPSLVKSVIVGSS